jgi:proton-translocating NADH-quinone oxidoreductase chain N
LIDFIIIFPELFLLNATIVLLVYGLQSKNVLSSLSILSLCSLFLTGLLLWNSPITSCSFFFNACILDHLTFFLKTLIIGSSFVTLFISLTFLHLSAIYSFETIILMLLSVFSMMILVSSYDLLPFYLAIELQSLCFYVLAASKRHSEFSTEAGLKYFLLGAFSSGILLFGFSLIYGFTGITNFEDLAKITMDFDALPLSMNLGIIFIGVGFLFKMTAVPFHMWAPDVYEGAPTSITAFFAIVPKVAILGVFLRFFGFCLFFYEWETIFMLSSLGSMILGSIAAMSQQKLKRLLAYSSISHVGFMLIGFCCGSIEGVQALLIYIIVYMLMTSGIFSIALSLKDSINFRSSFIESLNQFRMLAITNPILALSLTIILFSMAGIPPLAGFCSKFYLLFAALSSSLYVLACVGVLTSVISCFYYIRLIKIMYFESSSLDYYSFPYRLSFQNSVVLAFVTIFLVFFFIYPSPIFLLAHKTAIALCF